MRSILLISVLCFCASCSTLVWDKPGASSQDFNSDVGYCKNDSYTRATNALGQTNPYTQEPLFQNCMMSKGWHLEEKAK